MTDYIDLALKFGGFTNLDKVYLEKQLEALGDQQRLAFITPPPSVINAYFAELYQKQGQTAATDYYFEISKALHLFQKNPSFAEVKPFVRLNLSGKSYGFAFENEDGIAQVFSEANEPIHAKIFFDLAEIFPAYKIYQENDRIKMSLMTFDESGMKDVTPASALLSQVYQLKANMTKITSFNQDELLELLQTYQGMVYYGFEQRQYIAYIIEN
ncbi:cystathionine beta-lyase [Streptococcus jiangjianxini]|uniref:cystathionine beta-lyase n=1 Tax=Streptococcus jiangjianxini TaxID=3161189 RepID=UPI0032EC64F3